MDKQAEKKTNLRKEMKRSLKAMNPEQKRLMDHQVYSNLLSTHAFECTNGVYGYMSLPWETGTEEILKSLLERNIPLALPKVLGDYMEFYQIHSMEDLKKGAFHILEPSESCEMVRWEQACVLVPGLAFSEQGARLGKGGGYYDKFLNREPEHKTIALAYEFQIVGSIPTEEHDRFVDCIVTENKVLHVRNGLV